MFSVGSWLNERRRKLWTQCSDLADFCSSVTKEAERLQVSYGQTETLGASVPPSRRQSFIDLEALSHLVSGDLGIRVGLDV